MSEKEGQGQKPCVVHMDGTNQTAVFQAQDGRWYVANIAFSEEGYPFLIEALMDLAKGTGNRCICDLWGWLRDFGLLLEDCAEQDSQKTHKILSELCTGWLERHSDMGEEELRANVEALKNLLASLRNTEERQNLRQVLLAAIERVEHLISTPTVVA